jgi:dsDNA-binding SOS-regulon protein
MHDSKKEADEHDKMLELAEEFTSLLEARLGKVDDKLAEEFGLLLARNKEKVVQACKGKPEALRELDSETADNVAPLKASK